MEENKMERVSAVSKTETYKPEPKKRTYTPRANKKGDILEAAMRVFSWYGYEQTTMDMVANEAAVSRALVIKYFQNIDNLASMCVHDFVERFYKQAQHSAYQKGISYWEHTENLFEMLKVNRRQWQFAVSFVLPPSREGLVKKMPPLQLKDITDRMPDVCRPTNAPMIEHFMASLYLAYILGGNEQKYYEAKKIVFDCLDET